MKKVIKHSRYGDVRILEKIGPSKYLVHGKAHFMRGGDDMIDYEGGPFLQVGNSLDYFDLPNVIITGIEFGVETNDIKNPFILSTKTVKQKRNDKPSDPSDQLAEAFKDSDKTWEKFEESALESFSQLEDACKKAKLPENTIINCKTIELT